MAKIALVTGAARGIGRAVALQLSKQGYALAINDLEAENLRALADEIARFGGKAQVLPGDIAQLDLHESWVEQILAEWGQIDCLVNNAGVSVKVRGDLLHVSAESYNRCLDVNTRGTFFLTQKVARQMVRAKSEHHRCVVFITSANAVAASITRGEYCVSKAGLSMVAKLFATRLAPENIGVYEVQPGLIETDMTAPSKEKYDRLIAEGMTALPRWGTPQDVAHVVSTLASGGIPYTVGQEIRVDGGLNLLRF